MKKSSSDTRGPQDSAPQQPDKAGWIRKFCRKGVFREIWKNRFLVLRGEQLFISEKEVKDLSRAERVDLSDYERCEEIRKNKSRSKKNHSKFRLPGTKVPNLIFLAVSPEEKESWIIALNAAITRAHNKVLDEVMVEDAQLSHLTRDRVKIPQNRRLPTRGHLLTVASTSTSDGMLTLDLIQEEDCPRSQTDGAISARAAEAAGKSQTGSSRITQPEKQTGSSRITQPEKQTGSSRPPQPEKQTGSSRPPQPGEQTGSSRITQPEKQTGSSRPPQPGEQTGSSPATQPGKQTGSSRPTQPGKQTGSSPATQPGKQTGSSPPPSQTGSSPPRCASMDHILTHSETKATKSSTPIDRLHELIGQKLEKTEQLLKEAKETKEAKEVKETKDTKEAKGGDGEARKLKGKESAEMRSEAQRLLKEAEAAWTQAKEVLDEVKELRVLYQQLDRTSSNCTKVNLL